MPVVVTVPWEFTEWYTNVRKFVAIYVGFGQRHKGHARQLRFLTRSLCVQEQHGTLVSLLPEVIPELLERRETDGKKQRAAETKVKEGKYRGGGMELSFFFRPTEPKYHVLVHNNTGGESMEGDGPEPQGRTHGFSTHQDTLYVGCRPDA